MEKNWISFDKHNRLAQASSNKYLWSLCNLQHIKQLLYLYIYLFCNVLKYTSLKEIDKWNKTAVEDFATRGFHVLHVCDGQQFFQIFQGYWPVSLTTECNISAIFLSVSLVIKPNANWGDLWVKRKHWIHFPERQRQYLASFFSTDLHRACFGAVFWILSVVLNRCLLLILIYLPLLHPHTLEESTGPVLGGGWMCMQGFACVEMMSALYSMSKDRCVEDRLCHEYRHSQGKRAVLHKRLLALHLHTKHCANEGFGSIWRILYISCHSGIITLK